MAKRMQLHFQQGGLAGVELVEEGGKPVPCALGQPWVNEDTQKTLTKVRIPRTDPWGKPLPADLKR